MRRDWVQQVVEGVGVEAYVEGDVDEHAYVGVDDGAFQHVERQEQHLNSPNFQGQCPTCVLVGLKNDCLTPYAEDLLDQGGQGLDV